MSTLKLSYIHCSDLYESLQGSAKFLVDGQELEIKLTPEEVAAANNIAYAAYDRHKATLAKNILSAQRELLPVPNAIDAEYTEVPF